MYWLVLYSLVGLLVLAEIFSFFHLLQYSPLDLFFSTMFLLIVGWVVNFVFAKVYHVPANFESVYITVLILALIISPQTTTGGYVFLFWAGALAMASKYILAIGKKHIFNPAALAVFLTSYTLGHSATWWVGTSVMLPGVIIVGFLIIRKIRRSDMIFSFLFVSLATTFILAVIHGSNLLTFGREVLLDSPLVFFATIMLSEPLTTPPTRKLQIYYGALAGFMFAPQVHLGSLYFSPELTLVIANVFAYIVSPKRKLLLTLREKQKIGTNLFNFVFLPDKKMQFAPGQYLEWTLGGFSPDKRGNRRYFTIASAPTEPEISIGVKFYAPPSSFKTQLLSLKPGDTIVAGQLAGDFTLPKDKNQKLVFVAGGIGITPFRSMIKYLLDKKEKRDIVLFYSNRTLSEVAYIDIFNQAQDMLGLRTVYTLTDLKNIPAEWAGLTGYIDGKMIQAYTPDFSERIFYLSGPNSMVTSFEKTFLELGVEKSSIRTDFFPGFA